MQPETPKHTNALIHETSPYLLQHAHNPVNWLPWGEDAFALARMQNKPVLLSIGYSTCHWCHVMERESFEDEAVAEVLNRYFIAIKVDREERPDIDALYMHAARIISGSGGWPLNLLLTPDKKPFYAATYLPKQGRFGRIGLIELARRVGEMWQQDRGKIEASAESIGTALAKNIAMAAPGEIDPELIDTAYRDTAETFDISNGGFGDAPKFPTAHRLLFLLRYGVLKDKPEAITMVEKTLIAMQRGGIHDQLGGGFHRYATDSFWLVPHFEKMLYDQAMLIMAYTEGALATGNEMLAATARDTADYLIRDMRDADGAFYAAEDADSEGVEGKFYLWSADEISSLLGKRATAFMNAYGVEQNGNFIDESTHQRSGDNILHRTGAFDPARFAPDRAKLMAARSERVRPFRDDKILTDWNGLTIAALAFAGRALNEPDYLQAAARAADFILTRMRDEKGGLMHSWRAGRATVPAQLEDYSAMVWGLCELYESDFDPRWLTEALTLNRQMLHHFKGEQGGFFQTGEQPEGASELIGRPMDVFDSALPSGNAIAMHNLLRLSRLTGDATLEAEAAATANHFAGIAKRAPAAVMHLLSALLMAQSSSQEIVLAGDKRSDEASAMLQVIRNHYRPNSVLLWHDKQIEQIATFTRGQKAIGGHVTAYVCENFQCNLPVHTPADLEKLLN